ncbi:MAG: hypothetical protein K1W21_02710, partial [Oscillospiraceae bacterium]
IWPFTYLFGRFSKNFSLYLKIFHPPGGRAGFMQFVHPIHGKPHEKPAEPGPAFPFFQIPRIVSARSAFQYRP